MMSSRRYLVLQAEQAAEVATSRGKGGLRRCALHGR